MIFQVLMIGLHGLLGQTALAAPLPGEIVRLRDGELTREAYVLEKLPGLEAYVYADVPAQRDRLREVAELFAQSVYPEYVARVLPDPRPPTDRLPIALVFDAWGERGWPAYHHSALRRLYGRDVILINTDYSDASTLKYLLAHEIQHIFRSHAAPAEDRWLDEGLSKFAEYYLYGTFPDGQLARFLRNPSHALRGREQDPRSIDYFQSFFFVYYLYRHYGGIETIRGLMSSRMTGADGIDALLRDRSRGAEPADRGRFASFDAAFTNYSVALAAHRHADLIESFGFLDLLLGDDLARGSAYEGPSADYVLKAATLELDPLSARFVRLDGACATLPDLGARAMAVALDALASSAQVRKLAPGDLYCQRRGGEDAGQMLVLINLASTPARISLTPIPR